jgi:hypothetical protein
VAKKNEEKNQTPEEQAVQARQGNPDSEQPKNYVEGADGARALATPKDQAVYNDLPEGTNTVGLLEQQVSPFSPEEERDRQQLEGYPRPPEEFFDPHGEDSRDPEPAKAGRAATHRADVGRVVVVDYDTIHDGEVYKSGVQDLPLDVADALISEGKAWEPAGKKRGR